MFSIKKIVYTWENTSEVLKLNIRSLAVIFQVESAGSMCLAVNDSVKTD